ncbi:MAG: hypothetical protein F6K11_26800 [Leptolyngbya sp. SIO3F4]|nr:hypothetical protein [Leptolyngbya sp. SIO3F4]
MASFGNRRDRRQNKFGKCWEQTQVTTRLVVTYFNGIWQHSRTNDTAAQRAGLTTQPWIWHDVLTYPTFILRHDRLACWDYNLHKVDRVSVFDDQSQQDIRLFYPQIQIWFDHFEWSSDSSTHS